MSRIVDKAVLELDIFLEKEPTVDKEIKQKVLDLLQIFSSQGHSGMSASVTLVMFKNATKDQIEEVSDPEKDFYGGMTGKAVKELVEKFSSQTYNNLIERNLAKTIFVTLANQKPLTPITCDDMEWNDVSEYSNRETYQNKRLSAVFKEGKDGLPYYINAIIWKDQKGVTWSGSALTKDGEKIRSGQNIRLPFEPKTFYVDVESVEVAEDDWENYIKDESQLKEVFDYYDKKDYNLKEQN